MFYFPAFRRNQKLFDIFFLVAMYLQTGRARQALLLGHLIPIIIRLSYLISVNLPEPTLQLTIYALSV